MPGLQSHGDSPVARCAICGRPAAGPCARCRRSVCGDCCVLTEGGLTTFAICLRCERGGASVSRPWRDLVLWLVPLILALVAIGAVLVALRR
ncbi:MAG TPA: hypothetical protein VHE35_00685 [Kofleriaceae bacterium]|nr:hypothetical protein [Kofleriaceae bacterium]